MNVDIQIERLWPQRYSPRVLWINVGPCLFRELFPTTAFVEFQDLTRTDCYYILHYMQKKCHTISHVNYLRLDTNHYSMRLQFHVLSLMNTTPANEDLEG